MDIFSDVAMLAWHVFLHLNLQITFLLKNRPWAGDDEAGKGVGNRRMRKG
jgi:hypothetical protein